MKRLFLLILCFPAILFSFQIDNLKALIEVGYRTEISTSIIDDSRIDLFRMRLKYSKEFSDYVSVFVQGEYSNLDEYSVFPHIYTYFTSLNIIDALFTFNYKTISFKIGRFIPEFGYFLPKSILKLPSIHYPIANENFLNGRIDGIEFDNKLSLPYNRINLSLSAGHRYHYDLYRLASLTDDIGKFTRLGIFAGVRDIDTQDSSLASQMLTTYLYGSYLNFNVGPISLMGGIGKRKMRIHPNQLYYMVNGRAEMTKLWFNLFFERFDTEKELSASIDYWVVENRFDINTKYEINLNNKENRFYLLFKGII